MRVIRRRGESKSFRQCMTRIFDAHVAAQLAGAAAQTVQPELHLRPDRAAKYEVVAAVLASAQRLGLTRIGIIGSEQFIE